MFKIVTIFLAGVITGILIAPQKGSISRSKLARLKQEIKDNINGSFGEPSEIALEALDNSEEPAQPLPAISGIL